MCPLSGLLCNRLGCRRPLVRLGLMQTGFGLNVTARIGRDDCVFPYVAFGPSITMLRFYLAILVYL